IDASRSTALLEAALDVPRNGNPGLTAILREAGVAEDAVAAARLVIIERACQRGESVASVWRAIATGQPPAALTAVVSEGRAILAGLAECPHEIDALIHALDGRYVRPAPGADPIRAGAAALPSGRNIHSVDPWRLPSDTALERGRQMAEMLLARHLAAHGRYPETVAQTLWALDTIKSEGEALGVALALVGATPERDGQGKIFRYALVPLETLGRPRIDVLLDVSSVFRDTFQLSLDLLDNLFRAAATADEPIEQNFVKAHVEAMVARGVPRAQASARVFSQQRGRYGTGVDELVEESAWEDTEQLASTYLQRNAFAYGGGRNGDAAPETLRSMLTTVQHVFQPIDSVEFGLTDMQHYYGHSGAVQLATRHLQGVAAPLTYAESYTGAVTMTDAADLLRLEARAKLLNPRWIEGMLSHGYSGAAEIGNRFTYLLGWGAIANAVDAWVFDQMAETYVLDDAMRARLAEANPAAAKNAVARLLEANGRGVWPADEATIAKLQAIHSDLEDQLEGVVSPTAERGGRA
ncbi:MAG: cobaltochelatase subunit CobN, partial [Dehalococcoidia bacterium]|nr:cobaltochelatase subunit CobN [Dehalococcoidia bacterium]